MSSKYLTVYSHPDPDDPLVQLLASDRWGEIQSISFHPINARKLAEAILEMANVAAAARPEASVKIEVIQPGRCNNT